MDRLKYHVFRWLWVRWHMRFRSFFDSFTPTEYAKHGDYILPYAKYVTTSRPWWHMCCNGDKGGWRTIVCNYLENKWHSTRHYNKELAND